MNPCVLACALVLAGGTQDVHATQPAPPMSTSAQAPAQTAADVPARVALCDLARLPRAQAGTPVRVVAVHSALRYARVAFLGNGRCEPVPTLPRARTKRDASVDAFFDEEDRLCANTRSCGVLRLVDVDVLVRGTAGTGRMVELRRVHRTQPCTSNKACVEALEAFSR